VAYTSPFAFGRVPETFEPQQCWLEAWQILSDVSDAKVKNLEKLTHCSPNRFIRDKVAPAVKSASKGYSSSGRPESRSALSHCTLKAARAAGEFVRHSLDKLYNSECWATVWVPAAARICEEGLKIIDSSASPLEQEAVLSFSLVVGLSATTIEATVLTDSPKQITLEAERSLQNISELLAPSEDQNFTGVREQAKAFVQIFAGRRPGGSGSSGSGFQRPGEALTILVPKPDLLVPKAKPVKKVN
jgi:hypothetical protein